MRYHDIQLTGSLQITGSLTLPAGTTAERPTNPRSGSVRLNTTLGVMEIYTATSGSEWVTVGEQTGPGPDISRDIDYLLVAGGGGGGGTGGGGGAGGYLSSSLSSVESGSSFTVTVGSGGNGAVYPQNGTSGIDSSIAGSSITTITTLGGGYGAHSGLGDSGGSGGGGGYGLSSTPGAGDTGGSGTNGQGFDGGDGLYTPNYPGGGGGGASSVGGDAPNGSTGGNGGTGKTTMITGTSTSYAGGGGAGVRGGTGGTAVNGGGAGNGSGVGTAGTANTGGGGGSGSTTTTGAATGANGGSGVAIFAYESGSFNCAGGIVGDAGNGRKYNQFNQSGTFKVGNTTTDFQVNTNNLTGWWDAGDYSSRGDSTWTDKMGTYNLTKGGTPTLGNDYYYTMQANGEYYNTSLTVTNGAKAMVLWIKYTGAGGGGYSLTGWQEGGAYCYLGRQDSNGNYYYYIGNSTGGEAATAPTLNTWYMLTLTNNASGNFEFYENDGSTVIVSGTGINMGSNGTSRFNIGSVNNTGGHRNHAQIGMCFYYTKYLSSSDVNALYNATKTNFV